MTCLLRILSGLAIIVCAAATAQAQIASPPTCGRAIAASERAEGLPPQMLGAIGVVESGRVDPRTGLAAPWPWTINVAGTGRMFDTAADAIAAVQAAQAAGAQSIDVGCMQINLLHHPHAFATLQDAFDPDANVRYAAAFLSRLHGRTSTWSAAIAAYHSATPALGLPYAHTVSLLWPLASRYGLVSPDPTVSRRAALEAEIDPDEVLTLEFRARLVDAAMRYGQTVPGRIGATARVAAHSAPVRLANAPYGSAASTRERGRSSAPDRSALEDEVDPQRVLTPRFRAEMVAVARDRRRGPASSLGQDGPATRSRGAAAVQRPGRLLAPDAA